MNARRGILAFMLIGCLVLSARALKADEVAERKDPGPKVHGFKSIALAGETERARMIGKLFYDSGEITKMEPAGETTTCISAESANVDYDTVKGVRTEVTFVLADWKVEDFHVGALRGIKGVIAKIERTEAKGKKKHILVTLKKVTLKRLATTSYRRGKRRW